MTKHEQEMRQLIDDLNLFSTTITELQGKMTSENGQELINGFAEYVMPAVKQMKAICLVELGEV